MSNNTLVNIKTYYSKLIFLQFSDLKLHPVNLKFDPEKSGKYTFFWWLLEAYFSESSTFYLIILKAIFFFYFYFAVEGRIIERVLKLLEKYVLFYKDMLM